MGMLRRMYTCLPSLITLALIILPVLMTAVKLDNKDIKTVNLADFGGKQLKLLSDGGLPSYRILNQFDGSIYIGGNESLIRVDLDSNKQLVFTETKLVTTDAARLLDLSCTVLNPTDNETVCWNFIRVVEKLNKPPGELLVCGTNAHDRLCYRCNQLGENIDCAAGPKVQLNLVPRLPGTRPSSAVFGPDDNILFAALAGIDDPTLQKYTVPEIGDPVFELDTVTSGKKFIEKGAVFVGRPFEYTDTSSGHTYVFTFYREPAKEYESHGVKVYSRLSRVCKNDTGDISRSNKLASFIKARVNCSLPNEFLPFYYDLIQDVIWREDTEEVYAVFTSEELGPAASALCRYRMSDIMRLFDQDEFKDQEGGGANRLWLPLGTQPTPRPGTCDNEHDASYPPLLNLLVPNYNPINESDPVTGALLITSALPTLYIDGIRFTSLAADFIDAKCIFFFGTTTGSVLKAYKDDCSDPNEQFKAVKLNFMSEGTDELLINGLGLLGEPTDTDKVLVVTGGNENLDWPIFESCSLARVENECVTVFGPYCNWTDGKCVASSGSRPGVPPTGVLVQPINTTITSCGMDRVVLFCEADYGVFNTESVTVSWNKSDVDAFFEKNNHVVSRTDLSPSLVALEVTVIEGVSTGNYLCSTTIGGTTRETKQVQVINEACLTQGSLEKRCQCHVELDNESKELKKQFEDGKTCSIDVQRCDTCLHGSTTP